MSLRDRLSAGGTDWAVVDVLTHPLPEIDLHLFEAAGISRPRRDQPESFLEQPTRVRIPGLPAHESGHLRSIGSPWCASFRRPS